MLSRSLRYLADHLGPRPLGSEELFRARRYLGDAIAGLGFSPEVHAFSTRGYLGARGRLVTACGRVVPCQPVTGSPPTLGPLRGIPRLISQAHGWPPAVEPPGAVALCPLGLDDERRAVAAATQQRAKAALLYREQAPELYSAVIPNGSTAIPCVTVRPADALRLVEEASEVELTVEAERADTCGENLMVELGKGGRPLLFLANYDSRPGTPGAYRNASGVVALLGLLARLQGWRGHEVLVGFLVGEEPDAAGSRHCRDVLQATRIASRVRGVVYVSGVGRSGLAVTSASSQKPSNLADLVQQVAAEEGLSAVPPLTSAETASLARLWRRPVIALSGPSLPLQHTTLDRPDLLSPRYVSRVVSVLERSARTPWNSREASPRH